MKTATIRYTGELRTLAIYDRSGNSITTDAPLDNNGKGEAFSPTDLLATSLGCCMLTIMGIIANRNEINIVDTQVDIVKIMASDPRRVAEIQVTFHMPKRPFTDKEKTMLENAARTCPVALSLREDLRQVVHFNWN